LQKPATAERILDGMEIPVQDRRRKLALYQLRKQLVPKALVRRAKGDKNVQFPRYEVVPPTGDR